MKIKITELKNNPANPRNITEKEFSKLITSLLVFPEMLSTRPMIINASHEVLGGNQRLRALLAISQMEEVEISQRINNSSDGKKMKKEEREECIRHWVSFTDHQEVEVEMVHWSDHQQRQFIIKDNATFGEWDWDKLANEWDSDELNDWGVGVWEMEQQESEFLPEELNGVDLDPEPLEKFDGLQGDLEYKRIIICYKEEQEKELLERLGIEKIEKIIYKYEELC